MPNLLIVGASHGIGAAIAQQAPGTFNLYSIARSHMTANATAHFQCDITSDPLPIIDEPISALIYCPGSILLKPFGRLTLDDFSNDWKINVMGAVRCLQHYQRNLQAAENASVVLFSSVAVQTGFAYHASIAAAKGALEGLTRSLAAEWAPKIRVNAVAPSLTDTPLTSQIMNNETQRKAAEARHPAKRLGNPMDIAEIALFLASDKSSWVTGQVIHVDGGISSIKL